MTRLLEEAFERAAELPPAEQDAVAHWLIAELEAEKRWDQAFAQSPEKLERLANEALEEHRRGETVELDPKSL
jgi:hypothetical protein